MEIRAAEVLLPCDDPNEVAAFFVERLGLRVDVVWPAEDPSEVTLSGHGIRLVLVRGLDGAPGALRVGVAGEIQERELVAPNGTRVSIVPAEAPLVVPALRPSWALSRAACARWVVGRAGMAYRDLVEDRQGGRFVASLIRIERGGPVPDYVHFHRVRFQIIYCRRGWVRVVYEDQGEPLVMHPGDCVLQPPEIRHRVLECSDELEVVEVSSPSAHLTIADHVLGLPTGARRPERIFGGQRFVHHRAEGAPWERDAARPGVEVQGTGIADATAGLASVRTARAAAGVTWKGTHGGELAVFFVLEGALELAARTEQELEASDACPRSEPPALHPEWRSAALRIEVGDALTIPRGAPFSIVCSTAASWLEVTLPASELQGGGPLGGPPKRGASAAREALDAVELGGAS